MLMVLTIVLSQSDGALIGLSASLLVFIGFMALSKYHVSRKFLGRRTIALIVGLYVLVSASYVWFVNNPPVVANPYTRPGFTTFTVRQCVWQGTKAVLQERPVTGSGLAGFTRAYLPHTTCDAEPLTYPHMFVLNFWTETGLLGLVAISVFFAWWLRASVKLCQRGHVWWGSVFAAVLAYWLVHGVVDVPYFKNDLSMEWWALAALLALLVYRSGDAADEA
jgi:O-antigen ligase